MSKESHNKALKLEIKIRGYNILDNELLRNATADCFEVKPMLTIKSIMENCKMDTDKFIIDNKDILDKSLVDILNDKNDAEKFNISFNNLCRALDNLVKKL